jgi:hypothetical protein
MNVINDTFINKGSVFTDGDFRLLAIEKYYEWNPIDVESDEATTIRDFTASRGFVYDFKKRHRISSRRAHYKRRPKPNEARKRAWKKEINQLLRNYPPENILNCDETCWRLYPSGILTWAATGSENVAIEIPGDEKTSITAMATITADHQKLPLYLIAKGKTSRVEISQLGKIGIHQADHSPNGWQTVDTMKRYLKWLSRTCREDGVNGEIHLIMDIYRAHTADAVKDLADRLGIVLHSIPAGCTDLYQPLDRRVFGCLKATARMAYLRQTQGDAREKLKKKDAVAILLRSWDKLSLHAMESAWKIYRGDEEGEESHEGAVSEGEEEEISEDIVPDDIYSGTDNDE